MKIFPKTIKEAWETVWDILSQGDSRYNDPESELILANFIINEAISLEEREIPKMKEPTDKELGNLFEIQREEKYLAKYLLKQQGFQDDEIFFERRFRGSQPDVFAEKEDKIILVECCSCRVSKIIDFLLEVEEVWIITRGESPWKIHPLFEKMQWFVFKKGRNWNKVLEFEKRKLEELKKIKSPLDTLMEEEKSEI